MNLKLITAIATEPLTKADIKSHLRIDSETFAGDITTTQCITPGSHAIAASYSLEGTGVDVLGKRAIVNLNAGAVGESGKVDAKIQESEDDSTYTDWSGGGFTQVTADNDNTVQEKEYTGSKQYIRVVCTVATAACSFGVDIVTDSGDTSEDSQITAWIQAAREYGEGYSGYAFAPQTWDLYLPKFPSVDYIEWPKGPLTEITHVKYTDSDGTQTTMTVSDEYIVDVDIEPGKIYLPYGESWPSFVPYPYNAVVIRAVCGYTGEAPYIMPYRFKQAMLVHVGLMYKYRDAEVPPGAMQTVNNLYNMARARWF
jgi:uncharacterized phiE125 gp8 family phage protein